MINTIKKAVNRITWRMQNGWKFNQIDLEAVNYIISFINRQQKKQFNDYKLFAKLYIYVYGQFLNHYEATVFDKIPEKELHKIFDTSIENIIEDFKNNLNDSERYDIHKELGLSQSHPLLTTEAERRSDSKILEKVSQDKDLTESFFGEVWDYETVKDNLTIQINNAINNYA